MAQSLPNLNPKDFVCTFESAGNTFLFEDIVATHYLISESLIFSYKGRIPVFISKKGIDDEQKEAESRTPEETKKIIKSVMELIESINSYHLKTILTAADVGNIFSLLAAFCTYYEYFEPYRWDTSFAKSKNNKAMAENIALIGEYKNKIRATLDPIFFEKNGLLDLLVSKVSAQFNISPDEINLYREQEIINLFKEQRVHEKILADRRESYIFYRKNASEVVVIQGKDAEKFASVFIKESTPVISAVSSVIKGKTAHGKNQIIRGKVRIVSRDYADPSVTTKRISDMQKGEILVSETTDPEMMAALKKAAAVVTDVGGMLSHAAITARELDIPCIVGTGNASKILKDGDEVEVDTGKGVMRKV
jgi:phosphohistidine swiveling domain-containing protein